MVDKSEGAYSLRMRQHFSLMTRTVRETLGWNQYQLGSCIRGSQYCVSNFENATKEKGAARLKKNKKTRRRAARLSQLYQAVAAGRVVKGTPIDQVIDTVFTGYLSRENFINGERDEDLTDTITQAAQACGQIFFDRTSSKGPSGPQSGPVQQSLQLLPVTLDAAPEPEPEPMPAPEQHVQAEEVTVLGLPIVAVRLGENNYALAVSSICNFLGISTQKQVEKLRLRKWAKDRLSQKGVRFPNGNVQQDVWLVERKALPGWLFTINENNVAESKREGLQMLQLDLADALDKYLFEGVAVNPRAGTDQVVPALLRHLELLSARADTQDEALRNLGQSFRELSSSFTEVTLQLANVERTAQATISQILSDYRMVAPGKFEKLDTGVLYINTAHALSQVRASEPVKKCLEYFKCSLDEPRPIENNYFAWIRELVIKKHTWVNRRDLTQSRDGTGKEIPQRVFSPQEVFQLGCGVCAWIYLGTCGWKIRKFNVNGAERDVHYPDLDEAQKLLAEKGFSAANIRGFIEIAVRYLPLPGTPISKLGGD